MDSLNRRQKQVIALVIIALIVLLTTSIIWQLRASKTNTAVCTQSDASIEQQWANNCGNE